MLRVVRSGKTNNADNRYVIVGNSTDEKPTTDMTHGSLFEEVDTGKLYLFDEENTVWVEC